MAEETQMVDELVPRVEQEKVLLEWDAPERPYRKSGGKVMSLPIVIGILVGIILIASGAFMLIMVAAALIFAYYMWSSVVPPVVRFQVTTRGFRIGSKLYAWDVLTRWWFDDQWGSKMLVIEAPVEMLKRVHAPLGEMHEGKVAEVMEKMLVMERPEETMTDKMSRWMQKNFPVDMDKVTKES